MCMASAQIARTEKRGVYARRAALVEVNLWPMCFGSIAGMLARTSGTIHLWSESKVRADGKCGVSISRIDGRMLVMAWTPPIGAQRGSYEGLTNELDVSGVRRSAI